MLSPVPQPAPREVSPMAAISAFDIFKIGVGPSSSHTLGPWRTAQRAVRRWQELGVFDSIVAVLVDHHLSLAKNSMVHKNHLSVLLAPLITGSGAQGAVAMFPLSALIAA